MNARAKTCSSSSRRRWMKDAAFTAGGFLAMPALGWTDAGSGLSHTAEAIHQETSFSASPQRVYEALMNASQFQRVEQLGAAKDSVDVTSKPAQISHEPGGTFEIFGGYIVGRQIELIPNRRIVQAWHEKEWGAGIYSIARFELQEQGAGTKLIFDHTGFPAGAGDHLAIGWKLNYWEPLAKFFATQS